MSVQDIVRRAVLAYGFEEGVGTRVFDSSPKKNNGILSKTNGVLPQWVAGKLGFGRALGFDGVGAFVDCGVGTKINTLESNAVAGWVTIADVDAAGYHCWFGSHQGNRFFVGLNGGNYWMGYGDSGRTGPIANHILDSVPAHWIFGAEDGTARLFINGLLVDSFSYTGIGAQVAGQIIGARRGSGAPYNPDYYMDAIIDEVFMLPYMPTPTEDRMLYESRSAFTATPNLRRGLVLDLDFQEGAGLNVFDKSWYKNNGLISGASTWIAGGGLEFGVGGYANFGNDISLQMVDKFSVSFWVKINDLDDHHYLVTKGTPLSAPGNRGWATSYYSGSRRFYFDTYEADGTRHSHTLLYPQDNNWHKIVCTFDNGITWVHIDEVKGYIDGGSYVIGNINYNLLISGSGGFAPLDGAVDKAKIYNRILLPVEKRTLRAEGR